MIVADCELPLIIQRKMRREHGQSVHNFLKQFLKADGITGLFLLCFGKMMLRKPHQVAKDSDGGR